MIDVLSYFGVPGVPAFLGSGAAYPLQKLRDRDGRKKSRFILRAWWTPVQRSSPHFPCMAQRFYGQVSTSRTKEKGNVAHQSLGDLKKKGRCFPVV